jgi:hypothetical protein
METTTSNTPIGVADNPPGAAHLRSTSDPSGKPKLVLGVSAAIYLYKEPGFDPTTRSQHALEEISCVSEFGQLTGTSQSMSFPPNVMNLLSAPRIISAANASTWPVKGAAPVPPRTKDSPEAQHQLSSSDNPSRTELLGTYFLRKQQGEFEKVPAIPPRSLRRSTPIATGTVTKPMILNQSLGEVDVGMEDSNQPSTTETDPSHASIRVVSARPSVDTLDPRSSISQYINSHQRLLSTIAAGENLPLESIVNSGKFRQSHSKSFSITSQQSIDMSFNTPYNTGASNTPEKQLFSDHVKDTHLTLPQQDPFLLEASDSFHSMASSLVNQSLYLTPAGSLVGRPSMQGDYIGKQAPDTATNLDIPVKWSLGSAINRSIPEEDERTPKVSPAIPSSLLGDEINSSLPHSTDTSTENDILDESNLVTVTPKSRAKISPVRINGMNAAISTPTRHLTKARKVLENLETLPESEPLQGIMTPVVEEPSPTMKNQSGMGGHATKEEWITKSILRNPFESAKTAPSSSPPAITEFSLRDKSTAIFGEGESEEAHQSFMESLGHSFSLDYPQLDLPKVKTTRLARSQSSVSFQSPIKSPRDELTRKNSGRGRGLEDRGGSIRVRSRSPPAMPTGTPSVGKKVKGIFRSIGRMIGGKGRKSRTKVTLEAFDKDESNGLDISRAANGKDGLAGKNLPDESYVNVQSVDSSEVDGGDSYADRMQGMEMAPSDSTTILPSMLTSRPRGHAGRVIHRSGGSPHLQTGITPQRDAAEGVGSNGDAEVNEKEQVKMEHMPSLWSLLGLQEPMVSPMIDTSPKQTIVAEDNAANLDDTAAEVSPSKNHPISDKTSSPNRHSMLSSKSSWRFSIDKSSQAVSPKPGRTSGSSFSITRPSRNSISSFMFTKSSDPLADIKASQSSSLPSKSTDHPVIPHRPSIASFMTTKHSSLSMANQSAELPSSNGALSLGGIEGDGSFLSPRFQEDPMEERK